MTEVLREQLNDQIAQKILSKLIGAVSDGQEGFLQAANGAKEMQTGAEKLADGSGTLTGSLQQVQKGALQLTQGAGEAVKGTTKLSGGLGQIKNGNEQAAAQMAQGAGAVQQLGQIRNTSRLWRSWRLKRGS